MVFLVSAFALVFGSCKDDFTVPDPASGNTIMSFITNNPEFNVLNAALIKTGQNNGLKTINSGNITLFAPNDDAFVTYFRSNSAINATTGTETDAINFINSLTTTTSPLTMAQLNSILTYHMVSSTLKSDQLTGNQVFTTLNGSRLSISKGATTVLNANSATQGATIITFDAPAANGVVHTINRVMAVTGSLTTNVLSTIGTSATAPTTGITVSYATGVAVVAGGTQVGTANNYELLGVAIRKAGLAPTLLPNITPLPDFTIFAPTDAAFQTYLGILVVGTTNEAAAQTAINAMDPTALANILKYHIVSGRVVSTDLTDGQVVNTLLDGNSFTISISGSTITLVDKNTGIADPVIVAPFNALTNSGIVHTINGVLRSN